jgi:uncharacterized coiled-coil DUF342 family protein
MPTGIPKNGHRQPHNFQLIRDLKHEIRGLKRSLRNSAKNNIALRDELEKADKLGRELRGELHNLKAQAESYITQREELRNERDAITQQLDEQRQSFNKAFRELEDFTNDKIDQMKLLDAKLRLAEKDLAMAKDGREASERLDRERINQLIDVSHALARNC